MKKSVSGLVVMRGLDRLYELGVDTDSILARSGIGQEQIGKNGRIPAKNFYSYMLNAKDSLSLKDSSFFDNSLQMIYTDYPDLIGMCLNNKTGLNALMMYVKYRKVIGDCDEVSLSNNGEYIRVEYKNEGPIELGASNAVFNFDFIRKILQVHTSGDIATHVSLTDKKNAFSKVIEEGLETKCTWEENKNYIEFNLKDLTECSPNYNPNLFKFQFGKFKKDYGDFLSKGSLFSSHVYDMIDFYFSERKGLEENNLLNKICNVLGMSRWTLNRKLQEENISYRDLLNKVKMNVSLKMLRESSLSIQEISELLGFSSQTAFYRFFKGKMNESPSEFKNRIRC